MRLSYFSVKNYRSISKAEISKLTSSVVLVGPNNEGKSNILQGLHACLKTLSEDRLIIIREQIKLRYGRDSYDWQRDYPVNRQEKYPSGESIFELHFQLSEEDKKLFKKITRSSLNGLLPIELKFTGNGYATFKVIKRGKGANTLTKKAKEIRDFVAKTLDFAYIPAVRTAHNSIEVVTQLIEREYKKLEDDPEYIKIQNELLKLQQPIITTLGQKLEKILNQFIGSSIKHIDINFDPARRLRYLGRSCEIIVDDGTPTHLERKGDGIQSLVAIGLMSNAIQGNEEKDIILLIEEPESHLHPKAIHQLRDTIDQIREDSQIFITTHCPLLVNHENIPANIIVSKNNAKPADSISSLRKILGVRTSDNLEHAALVIVVEGAEDEIAFRALISHYSPTLSQAFANHLLTILPIHGASKLSYNLQNLKQNMANYFTILDDDKEGRLAFSIAQNNGLASPSNTSFIKCQGMLESEFEDLLDESTYWQLFNTEYGIDIKISAFSGKQKWSQRIRKGLEKCGKSTTSGEAWPEKDEYRIKKEIAQLIAESPNNTLHAAKQDIFTNIVQSIESRFKLIVT